MRVLAIDPGGKRLGLAVGDTLTEIATALEVTPYGGRRAAAELIAMAMTTHSADTVVIGLPTDIEGEETPACRRSHALVETLAELGIIAILQSEYLTTDEARRRARLLGRRSSHPVDDLAAQVILEEFFTTGGGVGRPS